jgi:hypothetical protein
VDLYFEIVGEVFGRVVRVRAVFFVVLVHDGLPGSGAMPGRTEASAKALDPVNNRLRFVIDDGLAMPTSFVGWFGQGFAGCYRTRRSPLHTWLRPK